MRFRVRSYERRHSAWNGYRLQLSLCSFRVDRSVLCFGGREDASHGFHTGEYARDLPKDFNGTVSVGDMRVFEEQDPSLHPQAPSIRSSPPNPHLITCAWSTGVSGPVLQMKTNVQLRKRNPETGTSGQSELGA